MDNIFFKKFDDISSEDITHLIDIGYKERQRIEYKREAYGNNGQQKKEMLSDISSMANASGGYLIIGIEEKDHIPVKVQNVDKADEVRIKIENSCMSNIEPHIAELRGKVIKMDSGENIIIFHIPRSSRKPHMINFKGINQFWIRHNDHKDKMTVEEIRDACMRVDSIWRDVKEFIRCRKKEIKDEIKSESYLIIGSSPIFIEEDVVDIKEEEINDYLKKPRGQVGRWNLSFQGYPPLPIPTLYGMKISYPDWITVEVFRNGYYEIRIPLKEISELIKQSYRIINDSLVEFIVNYYYAMMNFMKLLGIEQTIITYLSFFNVKNSRLYYRDNLPSQYPDQIRSKYQKNLLEIGPRQILSLENPDRESKYFIERIWNAFGFHLNDNEYFKEGKYYRR
jgi:hypothetical protein